MPTDEVQGSRDGLQRLDATRAAYEQTKANGQKADADSDSD